MQKHSPRTRLDRIRNRLEGLSQKAEHGPVEAAVGVLLLDVQGKGLETLLIQRPERLGDPWSGQVGFPGGRVKDSDGSVKDTVEREVAEEVGVDLALDGDVLGSLSIGRPGRNPAVNVQPWVYGLKRRPTLRIGSEVKEAFWAVLPALPAKLTTAEVDIRGERRNVECYLVDGHIVWGFTFRVLGDLMQIPEVMAVP